MMSNDLSVNTHRGLNRAQQSKKRSIDLFARYTLVSLRNEGVVVQGQCKWKENSHLAPVDSKDHRAITNLLVRGLSLIDRYPLFLVGHTGFMLLQFLDGVKAKNAYELCTPIIEASIEYFWHVILLPEEDKVPWTEIATYGLGPMVMFK